MEEKYAPAYSVQLLSRVWLFATPWTAALQASLSITNSRSLLRLMSVKLVMPSNHHLPFSSCLMSFPATGSFPVSQFSHQVAKILELQLHHSPSNEYSGLMSFRMDWFDLLAVQGLSRVFPNITIHRHWFFDTQLSSWSNSHNHTWLLEKPYLWLYGPLSLK